MFVSNNNLQQNIASNIKHNLGIPIPIINSALMDRLLPTFAGSQYGTIDTPITFTGDFEIEVEFATTESGIVQRGLFGDVSGGTTNYLQIENGAGKTNFQTPDGSANYTHSDAHRDGKIHTLTCYRLGNVTGIKEDGVIKASGTRGAASQVDIDLLGCLGITTTPSQFFNGQILSAKFTDAGTVVANFVFDSGSTTDQPSRGGGNNVTLVNFAASDWGRYTLQRNITHDAGTIAEAWVGDTVIINGRFDTDSDWTLSAGWSIAGGVATKVPGSTSSIIQDALALGLPYLLTFDIPRMDVVFARAYIGLGTLSANYTTAGTKKFFGVATTNTNVYILADTLAELDIDNIIANHILEVA